MVDHVKAADLAIPEKMWQLSLTEAQPTECNDLGYAYQSNNPACRGTRLHRAADAGISGARNNLGVGIDYIGKIGTPQWFEADTRWGESRERLLGRS